MPLDWSRGKNPYVHTYFGRLRLGANATPQQIVRKADELKNKLAAGKTVELAGVALDEHAISEAKSKLLEREALAEELLLVHPNTQRENARLKDYTQRLEQAITLPESDGPIALAHELCLLALLPQTIPGAVELPAWSSLKLVDAGDDDDLDLDIVFDG